jgi:CheY-like chemotaxis protein
MQRHGRLPVILLVEDDSGDIELTRRALEHGRLSNDLRVVYDGEQALDYLLQRGPFANPENAPRPDLILLDLNLPRVTGKEVLAEMRKDISLARIPTVALTTSRQPEDINDAYDLGANSFITKPLEMNQFVHFARTLQEYWLSVVVPPQQELS